MGAGLGARRGLVGAAYALIAAGLFAACRFGQDAASFERALVALGCASAAWLAACCAVGARELSLRWIVGGAVVLRLVALAFDPVFSDDIYRYVWEGHAFARGLSPYAAAPADAVFAQLRGELPTIFARMNHPDVSAAYPPLVQALHGVLVRIGSLAAGPERGALLALRSFYALCDLALLLPLAQLVRRAGRPTSLLCAWAWSPLVALEFAGSGHFDSLALLLCVSGLAAFGREPQGAQRRSHAATLLGFATAVKYLPAAALAACVRRVRVLPFLVAFGLAVAASFLPLVWLDQGARGLWGGLGEYGRRWEGGSLVFRFVDAGVRHLQMDDPQLVGRRAVAALWLGVLLVVWVRRIEPLRGFAFAALAFVVLTPTLHPWYGLWLLPFALVCGWRGLFVFVAALPALYAPLVRWKAEQVWEEPAWVWPVLVGSLALGLILERLRPGVRA